MDNAQPVATPATDRVWRPIYAREPYRAAVPATEVTKTAYAIELFDNDLATVWALATLDLWQQDAMRHGFACEFIERNATTGAPTLDSVGVEVHTGTAGWQELNRWMHEDDARRAHPPERVAAIRLVLGVQRPDGANEVLHRETDTAFWSPEGEECPVEDVRVVLRSGAWADIDRITETIIDGWLKVRIDGAQDESLDAQKEEGWAQASEVARSAVEGQAAAKAQRLATMLGRWRAAHLPRTEAWRGHIEIGPEGVRVMLAQRGELPVEISA